MMDVSTVFNVSQWAADIASPAFLSALVAIILIDLALAGDNAIVIGLAARQVPPAMQQKVLLWGSIAAVVVRAVFTLFVVWLLKIPGFLLAGGALLIWIAYKLVQPQAAKADTHTLAADVSLRQAVQTIVIADTAMGIENVLAVGGAAHGNMLLVVLGLLFSVPIIMFGSQLVLKLVDRFPHIVTLGGAILAWTAVKMMLGEPFIKTWVASHDWVKLPVYAAAIALVIVPVMWRAAAASSQLRWSLVAFVVVWLGLFNMVENTIGQHPLFEPGWHVGEEVIDLLMWVGWIPVALWLERWLKPRLNQRA
jgi:YjbE family integral membrane protein